MNEFPFILPPSSLLLSVHVNDSFRRHARARERDARGDGFRFRGGEREAEARAAARLALDLDCAAVLRDDLADDDEAEARAPPALLRRVERVEDVRAHLLGHARTRVREVYTDAARAVTRAVARVGGRALDPRFSVAARRLAVAARLKRGRDAKAAAFGHGVERVVDEVDEDLLQAVWVAVD